MNQLSQSDMQHLLWFKSDQHRKLQQQPGSLPVTHSVQCAVPGAD